MNALLYRPEPLPDAIRRWTRQAPDHLLGLLGCAGLLGAVAALALDSHQWPVATGLAAAGGLGIWGRLRHAASRQPSRWRAAVATAVGALTLLAAVIAVSVGLLVFLGPAPHF